MGIHLIAGLGNPGPKYARHRHNVGFMVVDALAERWGAPVFRDKFKGLVSKVSVGGEEVILLKPQTYMNLSGTSVRPAMHFFKVPVTGLLAVHDELDLPWPSVRLKKGGGIAGHNGLRSLVEHCGSTDFNRCRIGIGRPPRGPIESYVLSDFSELEAAELPDVIEKAADAVEAVVRHGIVDAMNRSNRRA